MRDESDPLRDLGKQLPYDRPDPARRDAVRSSLLIAANEGRRPGARSRWLLVGGGFAAGALAAAAIALLVMRSVPSESPRTHTRVAQNTDAKVLYSRFTATRTGTDHLMRVTAGKFSLEAPAGMVGEHIRMQTGNAEVEGSGMYEVVVANDALASVKVTTGSATVRLKNQHQAVFLSAGDVWRPSAITADLEIAPAKPEVVDDLVAPVKPAVVEPQIVAPVPAAQVPTERRPSVAAPRKAEPDALPVEAAPAPRLAVTAPVEPSPPPSSPPPAPTGNSATEHYFRAGYAMLRSNEYIKAAQMLGKAADGDGPLAADARYFQAVALTKAGRAADAERALVQFIDRAATSVRRGRAVVMLARLLAARGDSASARAWFEDALRDSDASVVAAARAGITGLN